MEFVLCFKQRLNPSATLDMYLTLLLLAQALELPSTTKVTAKAKIVCSIPTDLDPSRTYFRSSIIGKRTDNYRQILMIAILAPFLKGLHGSLLYIVEDLYPKSRIKAVICLTFQDKDKLRKLWK